MSVHTVGRVASNRLAYLLMLPAILLVVAISVYPTAYALTLSLYKTHYLQKVQFIGFAHYGQLLTDPASIRNVINSLLYVFGSLALALPLAMALALLLNQSNLKCRALMRTILIVPWVISQTITALLWAWLLNPDFGLINYIITECFIRQRFDFLANPKLAMPSLILVNTWHSYPLAMVLILAALQAIPAELYEAAEIDGASAPKLFRHITVPFISNTLMVTLIMLSLHYFNMVTLIFVLTAGGPRHATEVLSLRVYNEGFIYWNVGYATTMGVVIALFNVLFSVFYIVALKRKELY